MSKEENGKKKWSDLTMSEKRNLPRKKLTLMIREQEIELKGKDAIIEEYDSELNILKLKVDSLEHEARIANEELADLKHAKNEYRKKSKKPTFEPGSSFINMENYDIFTITENFKKLDDLKKDELLAVLKHISLEGKNAQVRKADD